MILSLFALSCASLRAELLKDSVQVHYQANHAEIDPSLMLNGENLQAFSDRLLRVLGGDLRGAGKNAFGVKLQRLQISGSASPEGSAMINDSLSYQRALSAARWVESYVNVPDSILSLRVIGRDWPRLLVLVENDPATPFYDESLSLLRTIVEESYSQIGGDPLRRLIALRAGVPYEYMLQRHFPYLRTSDILLEATVTPPIEAAVEDAISTDMVEDAEDADVNAGRESEMTDEGKGYVFALKTNFLYDLALLPNVGAEFPLGRHFSAGVNWVYAWWHNHAKNHQWRIYGGDIYARYYFGSRAKGASPQGGRPLTGHHIGLYAQTLVFQIALGGKGYISGIPGQNLWGKPYLGGGLEYGYSKRIGRRLNLDFTFGVGYLNGEYRVYHPADGHYVWESSHRRDWFGPTKAEISLVWLIGKGVAK